MSIPSHNRTLISFLGSQQFDSPFRHWIVKDLFQPSLLERLNEVVYRDTDFNFAEGKRIANSTARTYITPSNRQEIPVFGELAGIFEDPKVIGAIENVVGSSIRDCKCRIEYCIDGDGFWLEPHTDIEEKRLTMIIYTAPVVDPLISTYGTDLYNAEKEFVKQVAYIQNSALLFKPSVDTWHGFNKRKIIGSRRVLIVNYVSASWRDVHQLTC